MTNRAFTDDSERRTSVASITKSEPDPLFMDGVVRLFSQHRGESRSRNLRNSYWNILMLIHTSNSYTYYKSLHLQQVPQYGCFAVANCC